jgi:hypothetical protein
MAWVHVVMEIDLNPPARFFRTGPAHKGVAGGGAAANGFHQPAAGNNTHKSSIVMRIDR